MPERKPRKTDAKPEEQAKPKVKKITDLAKVEASENVVAVDTEKQPCSIVFIGHVDAGKSTISGQMIY